MSKQQVTVGLNVFVTLEVDGSSNPKEVVEEVQRKVCVGLIAVQRAPENIKSWVEVETQIDKGATISVRI